jgi:hypothetical protein
MRLKVFHFEVLHFLTYRDYHLFVVNIRFRLYLVLFDARIKINKSLNVVLKFTCLRRSWSRFFDSLINFA